MRRRDLIGGLTAALLDVSGRAFSQEAPKLPRIGVLVSASPPHPFADAFRRGLRSFGYAERKNITLEFLYTDGRGDRAVDLAAELVRSRVDIIVAHFTPATRAAMAATRTIPIVMAPAGAPLQQGLIDSLARPGGNVTGLSQQLTPEIRAKQLQLIREVLPKASSVVVLWSSSTTVGLKEYEVAGQPLGLKIRFAQLKDRDDLPRVFAGIASDRADAVLVPGDTLLFIERRRVVDLAREHRLPAMYSTREFTVEGGLMSYSARLTEQFRSAADYVDKILRGATPATLPVESPSHYELAINLRTAKALGLVIPQALIIRADEVIR